MKKYLKVFIIALLVLTCILSLTACGSDSAETANEKADIECMDAAETLAMAMWLKQQDSQPELCMQLAGEGLYYDSETDSLIADAPAAGYGKGTTADGGETWSFYCGVENGVPVVDSYENGFDYTNCCLKVQYDEASDCYFMNWIAVE